MLMLVRGGSDIIVVEDNKTVDDSELDEIGTDVVVEEGSDENDPDSSECVDRVGVSEEIGEVELSEGMKEVELSSIVVEIRSSEEDGTGVSEGLDGTSISERTDEIDASELIDKDGVSELIGLEKDGMNVGRSEGWNDVDEGGVSSKGFVSGTADVGGVNSGRLLLKVVDEGGMRLAGLDPGTFDDTGIPIEPEERIGPELGATVGGNAVDNSPLEARISVII